VLHPSCIGACIMCVGTGELCPEHASASETTTLSTNPEPQSTKRTQIRAARKAIAFPTEFEHVHAFITQQAKSQGISVPKLLSQRFAPRQRESYSPPTTPTPETPNQTAQPDIQHATPHTPTPTTPDLPPSTTTTTSTSTFFRTPDRWDLTAEKRNTPWQEQLGHSFYTTANATTRARGDEREAAHEADQSPSTPLPTLTELGRELRRSIGVTVQEEAEVGYPSRRVDLVMEDTDDEADDIDAEAIDENNEFNDAEAGAESDEATEIPAGPKRKRGPYRTRDLAKDHAVLAHVGELERFFIEEAVLRCRKCLDRGRVGNLRLQSTKAVGMSGAFTYKCNTCTHKPVLRTSPEAGPDAKHNTDLMSQRFMLGSMTAGVSQTAMNDILREVGVGTVSNGTYAGWLDHFNTAVKTAGEGALRRAQDGFIANKASVVQFDGACETPRDSLTLEGTMQESTTNLIIACESVYRQLEKHGSEGKDCPATAMEPIAFERIRSSMVARGSWAQIERVITDECATNTADVRKAGKEASHDYWHAVKNAIKAFIKAIRDVKAWQPSRIVQADYKAQLYDFNKVQLLAFLVDEGKNRYVVLFG